ncbi:MAG: hypothetical protein ACI9A2_004557 [Halioglobus sp.]|jgi:hypothetical protein
MEKGGPKPRVVYDVDSQASAVSLMLRKVYEQTLEFMGEEEGRVPAGPARALLGRAPLSSPLTRYASQVMLWTCPQNPQLQ